MPIPAQYRPPNHGASCPYCRLQAAMERVTPSPETLEPPTVEPHGTPAPVVSLLKRIGRLVGKRP